MTHEERHEKAVEHAKTALASEKRLFELADLFRLFADSTRVRILCALRRGELCVGALSSLLSLEQSTVSHQLKVLRESRLVTYRREGKTNLYSLSDEHVSSILDAGFTHLCEEEKS